MRQATEREQVLVKSLLEQGAKAVAGIKVRYAESMPEAESTSLRVGLVLPVGLSLIGDEAYLLHEVARVLSDLENYHVRAVMTPICGEGDLLDLSFLAKDLVTDDAVPITKSSPSAGTAKKSTSYAAPVAILVVLLIGFFVFAGKKLEMAYLELTAPVERTSSRAPVELLSDSLVKQSELTASTANYGVPDHVNPYKTEVTRVSQDARQELVSKSKTKAQSALQDYAGALRKAGNLDKAKGIDALLKTLE